MKLGLNINLPAINSPTFVYQLYAIFRQIITQLNNISDGMLAASYSATAAPTTGTHSLGDVVKNSNPSELGAAGGKYVITGWICTTAGAPGAWKETRTLTGN